MENVNQLYFSFNEPSEDCQVGIHTYFRSKVFNKDSYPVCSFCSHDTIDWERLHKRDITDVDYLIAQIQTEKVRKEWWDKDIDEKASKHAYRKGLSQLEIAITLRLKKSVGDVYDMPDGKKRPYRDGFQTPYSGNIIYYAQHALACCCRRCLNYWHGIRLGYSLDDSELKYFSSLVKLYIQAKLPGLPS